MKGKTVLFFSVMTMIIAVGAFTVPASAGGHGAVYVMTNAAAGNEIAVYDRAHDGTLMYRDAYATGGDGTGDGLGSQQAITLTHDGKWLLAVNAGSDEVSVLKVKNHSLELTDTVSSGGMNPISVAVDHDKVFVLNAGGGVGDVDTVTGFELDQHGHLTALGWGPLTLSDDDTGPAQVGVTPDGEILVVTEKATNLIDTFILDSDETADESPDGPIINDSEGDTPFGFYFGKRDQLFVSEAFGAAPDAGTVSSYEVQSDGTLMTLDPTVATNQTAPCWIVVTKDGKLAYTANTPSDSLSGFDIDHDGMLTLLDADGRTGEPGAGTNPLDIAFSKDEKYLYTLNSGDGTVGAFEVEHDGALTHLGNINGLPMGATGLAAR